MTGRDLDWLDARNDDEKFFVYLDQLPEQDETARRERTERQVNQRLAHDARAEQCRRMAV